MIRREYYTVSGAATFDFALTSGGAPVDLTGYVIKFIGRSDKVAKSYLVTIPGGNPTSVAIPYTDIYAAGDHVIKGRWHIQPPGGTYLVSEPEHITIR